MLHDSDRGDFMTIFVQTVSAIIGTVGFCLFIRLRLNRLPIVAVATAACFLIYTLFIELGFSEFAANLYAAAFTALAAEISAIIFKAPVTVFLIPPLLPLIPGAHLYYSMEGFFKSDSEQGVSHLMILLQVIGGLVLGITVVLAVFRTVRRNKKPKSV